MGGHDGLGVMLPHLIKGGPGDQNALGSRSSNLAVTPMMPMGMPADQQQDLASLNFSNIKHFLLNSEEEIKICATLQALRWRLTKTKRK